MQSTNERAATQTIDDPDLDPVGEFIATLLATPAHRLTACRGWTTHELVAHLAAGAAEEADVIEAHLAGSPRATHSFDEREPPFRALADGELRERLVDEAGRLNAVLERLVSRYPDERVAFTGRLMNAAEFAVHGRSECTLHRWDLVGRDVVGWQLLAQPSLTRHALRVLTSMSTLPEAPANRLAACGVTDDVRVVVRSAPCDDLVVTVVGGAVELTLTPIGDAPPDVELDASSRLLTLWGRRDPSSVIDLHAGGAAAQVVETLFGW